MGLGTGHRKPDSVRPGRLRPGRTIISLSHGPLGTATSPPERGATNTRVYPATGAAGPDRRPVHPVLSCTAWGFSCPLGHPRGGELLPRHFTLTLLRSASFEGRYLFCDTFRRPAITTGRPGFHRACCRVVSGLSSPSRRRQRSSPARSKTQRVIAEPVLRHGKIRGRLSRGTGHD